HWCTPIYHEGHVYGTSGRHMQNADLRCVELTAGRVKWNIRGLTRLSLLMVDGHFVGLTEEADLLLFKFDPNKCDVISEMDLREGVTVNGKLVVAVKPPCWAAPILSHGLLYVRARDHLVCLELIPVKSSQ